jgi:nicotinamide mononucleotide adenylyltransferase
MKNDLPKGDVGIIVGRFQVDELHEAHTTLIRKVVDNYPKNIIFLGLSPLKCTGKNPLDFEARKQMILNEFPDVNVLYIKDVPDDALWSKNLDEMIEDLISPHQRAILFGGRDAFLNSYSGKYDTF